MQLFGVRHLVNGGDVIDRCPHPPEMTGGVALRRTKIHHHNPRTAHDNALASHDGPLRSVRVQTSLRLDSGEANIAATPLLVLVLMRHVSGRREPSAKAST
jgi:hypothetical protein